MHPRSHSVLTGAVAWQQSIAIEARGTAFTVGPSGVTEAASTGTRQGVAVTEDHVRVSITAAVAGLTGAAQHQRVPKKARCTPGDGDKEWRGGGQGLVALLRAIGRDSSRLITARRRHRHSLACRGTGFGHFLRHNRLQNCKDKISSVTQQHHPSGSLGVRGSHTIHGAASGCGVPTPFIGTGTQCWSSHPLHQGSLEVRGFPPALSGLVLHASHTRHPVNAGVPT